ncbi:MAG: PHP domain-containing protein [Oscillospiraceae bacterium]|nr:PHP domain-containing protein [Oscillospiraceae bacterium]
MGADLHCHTRLSDGSMGIDSLVILAKKQGIKTIAITDHDCLAANVRGKRIGEQHGITVLPGVELSSTDAQRGQRAHLICYLPDSPDRLEGLCRRNLLESKKISQYMILKTCIQYPVTPEFIIKCATGSTGVYKQHIMHALMESGLSDRIYGEMYTSLFSAQSETNVLREAKYPSPKEILEAIHDAGGIAVLAHPALYNNFDLLEELIPEGLDGVEVWHPSASEEDVARLQKIAKKNGLLMTGGSDFHGMYGTGNITIGSCQTPDANLDELLSYKTRKRRQMAKAAKAAAKKEADTE